MKSIRLLQQICHFLQPKLIIVIVVANIVSANCFPLTQDETSNKKTLEEEKRNISTNFFINPITDNKIQQNDDKNNKRIEQTMSKNHLVSSDGRNDTSKKSFSEHKYMKKSINIASNKKLEEAVSSILDLPTCILGSSHVYLSWWVNENGSLRPKLADNNAFAGEILDLSLTERTEKNLLELVLRIKTKERIENIVFMSLAHNGLSSIPRTTLLLVDKTLQYLSLAGNHFSSSPFPNTSKIVSGLISGWATFPELLSLVELDLRNCSIQHLTAQTFANVPNLKKLYLSHNNFIQIPSNIFRNLRLLVHLDLAYQNIVSSSMNSFNLDPYAVINEGLNLPENVFHELQNLVFLDLSHSRIIPSSVKAFTMLGPNLQQLSLCYTNLPIIVQSMFSVTNLKVLDISGNPGLTPMIRPDSFLGLEKKLEILAFANSNLKHLGFIQDLTYLKVLKLNDNNINQLSIETFQNLEKLEVIDFSSNHIGNWYAQAFQFNSNLRVLNLRDNNINLLTADMMTDFSIVDYLAIGNNNFICNCMLREFIELAAKNTRLANCSYSEEPKMPPTATQLPVPLSDFINGKRIPINPNFYVYEHENKYDIVTRIFNQYQASVTASTQKIKESSDKYGMYWNLILYNRNKLQSNESHNKFEQNSLLTNLESSVYCNETHFSREHHISTGNNSVDIRLNFTFRLLDYNENDYVCIHSENNTEHYFVELDYCLSDRNTVPNFIERFQTNSLGLGTLLLVMVIFAFILLVYYHKWWDIRYIFLLVKNATILSQLNKEKKKMKNDDAIVEAINSNYNYDVFVSYSEPNRHWILTEFLPNIESENDVNVCLHERDFQVGLSILENIISCMDRSRCILLVISESFLVSHWCQFEMHLAQHRLLETKREQMILVLLENIPKGKRPKTLQFLMKTKTYIVWPTKKNFTAKFKEKSKNKDFIDAISQSVSVQNNKMENLLEEERKLFWKRLKKALVNASWESDNVLS